jgi:hypothetical protein
VFINKDNIINFQDLRLSMEILVFWDVKLFKVFWIDTDVLVKCGSLVLRLEDGGSMFFKHR